MKILGIEGENLAVTFLKEKGYRIIARNYKTCIETVFADKLQCNLAPASGGSTKVNQDTMRWDAMEAVLDLL